MQKTTLIENFNSQNLAEKYFNIWNDGQHLFTVNDYNRDFQYSIFYIKGLFAEVIYNKLDGNILTINSFSDKKKLQFYLDTDFS
ncbi:hypothetical protein ACJRPK_06530 [Aquimarina sp. 2-A2]|uniref:hypothetical protein n=1 Tax=Aquimarina sp. 2-A2 TaxID=3382644 RepID=UPI00387EFA5A